MRKKDDAKRERILSCINAYFSERGVSPSVRDIASGTGISPATVQRYLADMREDGTLENGAPGVRARRSVTTERIGMEAVHFSMPVLGYVACGPGEEETEEIIEYIRLPERLVGRGTFFALIAKGESMTGAGIFPGDTVVVDRERTAAPGDPVVALCDGRSNLKILGYDGERGRYVLRSCHPDKERYPDIYPDRLEIQGVAVCVTHPLGRFPSD